MSSAKSDTYTHSLSYYVWQRLKKDKLAMFGIIVIGFVMVIAILGYLITPDSTPDCNQQILELSIKPPGFKVKMMMVRKNEENHHVNWLDRMLFGEHSNYRTVPIYSYHFKGFDVVCDEYTGSDKPSEASTEKFNLADVLFPLNYNLPVKNDSASDQITFYKYGSTTPTTMLVKDLQAMVKKRGVTIKKYILGTDREGRDLLSRLMIGSRVSLAVGFVSVVIAIFIGILMGAVSGFFRGWIDNVIMWVINVVWAIPTLLLVIAITLVLGKGFWQVFIAVGLTMWVDIARVMRGQIFSLRETEFIEAGRAMGFTNFRIILRHIIPNVMGPVIVLAAADFASAILIEAGLSFLGIGAQPPMASWGAMINANRGYIITNSAYLAFLPGIAIMITVLAFILLGNGLRDAMDTKLADDHQIVGS